MDPLIARARAPKVLFGLLSELEFQIQRSLARSRVTFTCLPRHDLFQRAAFEATRKHLEINVLSISLFLSLSLSLSLSLAARPDSAGDPTLARGIPVSSERRKVNVL